MPKIAFAAFVLGLFSLSPNAKAFESLDDNSHNGGMSMSDLKNISKGGKVTLKFVGNQIVFDASIPVKCATGASVAVDTFTDPDSKTAPMHSVRFVPGKDCHDLSDADRNQRVWLHDRDLFGSSRDLANKKLDGGLCLVHNENGSEDSCDKIDGQDYVSQDTKTRLAEAEKKKAELAQQKADAEVAKASREQKEKWIIEQLTIACKNGDWANFGSQIEAARQWLGDVTNILDKMDKLKQKYYADQISKAKDVEAVKDAYQAYLDAAGDAGWDTDAVTTAYATKRVELMNSVVNDGSKTASARAAAIRELASDLRELGLMRDKIGDTGHSGNDHVGGAYFALASKLRDDAGTDAGKLAEAEKYFREAERFGDNAMTAKVEAEIAKMYNAAADQCINDAKEKGKGFNTCDALARKAKGAMDKAIAAVGKSKKSDDSMEALAAMKQERLVRFGMDGTTMSMQGYGSLNPRGGTYDQTKYQAYTQAQQQFIMNMYMRGSMSQYGIQPGTTTGGTGGSYFSN